MNLKRNDSDENIKLHRKSKYKYVQWAEDKKRWRVVFYVNGKKYFFGSFKDEDEAGRVAFQKAKEYGKKI